MKKKAIVLGVLLIITMLTSSYLIAEAGTLSESPYYSLSPDGQGYTICAGDKTGTSYSYGTTVTSGISSSLRPLENGEHYYEYNRIGKIPVGKWVVEHPISSCCHEGSPTFWVGLTFPSTICNKSYYSGWIPYCADCNEPVFSALHYISKEAAESIDYYEIQDDPDSRYYYACPHCNHLEMAAEADYHRCKDISWNQYQVAYNKNTSFAVNGTMANSYHMYNNETTYEGQPINPVTTLRKNKYELPGYRFTGWNTKSDGTGTWYADGAEIYNLTSENNAVVILYAQWELGESTLQIDPNGGKYDGKSEITRIKQYYGTSYSVTEEFTNPSGYTLSFETNGGEPLASIIGTVSFIGWTTVGEFNGRMIGNVYYFSANDGNIDTIKATYDYQTIILPEIKKSGYVLEGWYYDENFERLAGISGDTIEITEDMVLYAKWEEFKLTAQNNYLAYGGSGAVNLEWNSIKKTTTKAYLLYQSIDKYNWTKLYMIESGDAVSIEEKFTATGTEQTYTVLNSGFYTITATGAQGENYKNHVGGKGGQVSATVWLTKGEVLTYRIGTSDGYNDGGTGTSYGNGGGMTSITSNIKGLIMIAGGGGGASEQYDGGAGGIGESHVTDTTQGENGGSGGGGGYKGGKAGTVEFHNHTGNSVDGGGCYGESTIVEDVCGNYQYTGYVYMCSVCGSNACWGHANWENRPESNRQELQAEHAVHGGSINRVNTYKCSGCGAEVNSPGKHIRGTKIEYSLDCGMTEGQILTITQSYGGSNYVNTDICTLKLDQSGIGSGDGAIDLYLIVAEYVDEQQLENVAAPDMEAPDKVSESSVTKNFTPTEVTIMWDTPADNGTVYYHKAEAYDALTASKLCESNITMNTLVSGVAGYRYVIDENRETIVTESDEMTTENTMEITLTEKEQYLHVAVEDIAGNISETVHISIGSELSLSAYVERILTPHDPIFKCGESGILYIVTTGFVERVEVTFPTEMLALNPDMNKTYTYTVPQYTQEEQLQFMIPLYTPESADYQVIVRAYKGDREVEPEICILEVNGTVLDDIRTRLR